MGKRYAALLQQQAWTSEAEPSVETPEAGMEADAEAIPPTPAQIVEALLFVGGGPLAASRAAEIVRGLGDEQFHDVVRRLNRAYRDQGRPYLIQAQGNGYVLTLRPRYRSVLDKLYGGVREARLSNPAIDVLALVAYRQPATKEEIDNLRGVESGALLRQLVRRGLIAVVQRGEASQRQVYYGTTPRFLQLFHLKNLDDLPHTQDLQQL
jgi:segregation and condensation protein B